MTTNTITCDCCWEVTFTAPADTIKAEATAAGWNVAGTNPECKACNDYLNDTPPAPFMLNADDFAPCDECDHAECVCG